jgi:sterol 3beta-glucosyltransferase
MNQPQQKRILIPIPGSRGDVLPFLALALHLHSQFNHKVCLGISASQETWMTSLEEKVEYYIMDPDPLEMIREARKTPKGKSFFGPTAVPSYAQYKYFKRHFRHIFDSFFESTMEAGLKFKPDLVIFPVCGQAISPAICEKLRVPFINVHFYPSIPTKEFPPPEKSQGSSFEESWISKRVLNKVSWKLFYKAVWNGIIRPVVNSKRYQIDLPLYEGENDSGWNLFLRDEVPFVYLFSSHIIPKPKDWPAYARIVGSIGISPDSDETISPESVLGGFLFRHKLIGDEKNTPSRLFYIGFGSMLAILDEEEQNVLFKLIVEGISAVGVDYPDVCAVISASYLEKYQVKVLEDIIHYLKLDKSVLLINGGIKHSALFPLCSGVVHHGGAGTTHTAAIAGVPQLMIPFGNFDQAFWGGRIEKLNAGLRPIFVNKLSLEGFANSLREFIVNSSLQENARLLAESMKAEDGLEDLTAIIQEEL